jgi:hypothetical protein
MSDAGCKICCVICIAVTALVIILMSIGTVEPIEFGIKYNSLSKKTDEENVYPGGWYMIGPLTSFIVFPSTLINIDWTDYSGA